MTAVTDLVGELRGVGVQLWSEEGELRFRAPAGVLTEGHRSALRRHKSEVLAQLAADDGVVTVVPDPDRRDEPFPLTDVQAAYLVGRASTHAYGDVGCTVYSETAFPRLDPARIRSAWADMVRRHDMLRAVVDEAGHQRFLSEVPEYEVPVQDVRGHAQAEVDAAIERFRAGMDHRVYRPDRWPLFDLRLTVADDHVRLHLSVDFLIADYLSIQLLLEELVHRHEDPAAEPQAPALSFRDYLLAERSLRQGTRYERDRDYWRQRLDDLPGAPDLPVAGRTGNRFSRRQAEFSPGEWKALRREATSRGVTPSVAVLSSYAEVISRWSATPRYAVNLTVLNRRPLHPDVDRLVGDFTSVSLLAVEHAGRSAFGDRSARLQTQLSRDLDHQTFSGVEVLRELARRRGPAAALMPVVFTSTIGLRPTGESGVAAAQGEFVYGISQTPQVWIDCQAVEDRGGLTLSWDVRDGVLEDGVAQNMFRAQVELMRDLAAGRRWEEEQVVPLPADQHRSRAAVLTEMPLPERALHDDVVSCARRHPDRPAVLADERTLTYGDLLDRAHRLAERILDLDPHPGRVGVVMDKGWEQYVAVLGILLAGGSYVPVDTTSPPERRRRILAGAGVRIVVTRPAPTGPPELPPDVEVVPVEGEAEHPVSALDGLPGMRTEPDDLAYVIYTSGSTGAPKGVMVAHRAAVNTIEDIARRHHIDEDDRVLALAHLGFDLSVFDVFGPLSVGGGVVVPDPERRGDPTHWAEIVARRGVTVWNSVPAQMQMLHDHLAGRRDGALPTLRLAMLSGDWVPVGLPDAIRTVLPDLQVVSLGGATEAAIWSIEYPVDIVPVGATSIPYGRPLTNQSVHVLDEDMLPCPDWVAGELYIGGAGVALGYIGDPELTGRRFVFLPGTAERLYRTGDYGRFRDDGVIEFLGRADRQVKVRGHRIELAEIEAAMDAHPRVTGSAVVVEGERTERSLAAFVEPARRTPTGTGEAPSAAVAAVAVAAVAASAFAVGPEADRFVDFTAALEEFGRAVMVRTLRRAGLFGTRADAHTTDDVLAVTGVVPQYTRTVRRWLWALRAEGVLETDEAGRHRATRIPPDDEVDRAWARVGRIQDEGGYDPEVTSHLRASTDVLPEMLRGELDPLQVLFPEGRRASQESFKDYLIGRYVSEVVIASVRAALAEVPPDRRPMVLEAGAGGWGNTAALIDALADQDVDYLYTHPSAYFLTEARERLAGRPWVRFAAFDLDRPILEQGFAPNSVDVLVSHNFLHSGRDVPATLRRLRELVVPGGWLVFFESTEDSLWIMTSLELTAGAGDYDDVRAVTDRTFLSRAEWLDDLREHMGAEVAACLPGPEDTFAGLGQHVFACRVKGELEDVRPADVVRWLRDRVPEYMVPPRIRVLDRLPLTDNGKVDRGALTRAIATVARPAAVDEAPVDDLERLLAEVWSEVLGTEQPIGRTDNFFTLGGDSLLAARLMGRVREAVPAVGDRFWDSLVRRFMPEPTIAALAAALSGPDHGEAGDGTAAGRTPQVSDHLVVLAEGPTEGPADTMVLVCDATASTDPLTVLVGVLAPAHRVLALVPAHPEDLLEVDPARVVERLAGDLAAALPDEPVHLVGAHGGGVLAVEVAARVLESGRAARVTVVSSYPIPCRVDDDVLAEYLFALAEGVDPEALGYPGPGALGRAVRRVLAASPGVVPAGALAELDDDPESAGVARAFRRLGRRPVHLRCAAIGRAAGDVPVERLTTRLAVHRALARSLAEHVVAPFAGDVTLVRHTEDPELWPTLREDMTAFWADVCLGELTVVDVAGGHFDVAGLAGATATAAAMLGPVTA